MAQKWQNDGPNQIAKLVTTCGDLTGYLNILGDLKNEANHLIDQKYVPQIELATTTQRTIIKPWGVKFGGPAVANGTLAMFKDEEKT